MVSYRASRTGVSIEITGAGAQRLPIAIAPFAGEGALPAGLSAIYFYYEPALRDRSLGIWNVLAVLDHAAARGLPHVYLGYFVAGCGSMEYKAGFVPNEVLGGDGRWHAFRK